MKKEKPPLACYRLLQEWEKHRVEIRLKEVRRMVAEVRERQNSMLECLGTIEEEVAVQNRHLQDFSDPIRIPGLRTIRRNYVQGLMQDRNGFLFEVQLLGRTLASRSDLLDKLLLEQSRLESRLRRLEEIRTGWFRRQEAGRQRKFDREMGDVRSARRWADRRETDS